MNKLTAIVIGSIFVIALLFFGVIFYGIAFKEKPPNTTDILDELKNKKGGVVTEILPGREMLEVTTEYGKVRIGYWLETAIGEQVRSNHLHIRILSAQPFVFPDFWIETKRHLVSARTIIGFKEVQPLNKDFAERFLIFLEENASVEPVNEIVEKIHPFLLSSLTKVNALRVMKRGNAFSVQYQYTVKNVEEVDLMFEEFINFIRELQLQKPE